MFKEIDKTINMKSIFKRVEYIKEIEIPPPILMINGFLIVKLLLTYT